MKRMDLTPNRIIKKSSNNKDEPHSKSKVLNFGGEGSPPGVAANVLDFEIVVSKFELQLHN